MSAEAARKVKCDDGLVMGVATKQAQLIRAFGWGMLFLLAALLINNTLQVGFDYPSFQGLPKSGAEIVQTVLYCLAILLAVVRVVAKPNCTLKWEARRISEFNAWLVRAAFFAVLFVGLADAMIALIRVEDFLAGSKELANNFRRPHWIGIYIHVPLIILGTIVACFSRTLGFPWLALLIVAAELLIVITRFIFSYEQALMGDLVRYWYAALFLFASAHTLIEEGHVRVDVFYAGFGPTTQGFCNAVGTILFGMVTAWTIILISLDGKHSIINSAIANFEISQSGMAGMFVKYQMASFLGIFAITMLIQFVSYLFESVNNIHGEIGRIQHDELSH